MTSRILRPAALTFAILASVAGSALGAQERRRSPDGAGGASPVGVPMHPRAPFAGAWQGSRRMSDGPGREGMPYAIVIEADSAGNRYTAFAILPDGQRHAVDRVSHADGVLSWRQPNSGGGTWFYTARLVGRERIEGTLVLRDWPQGGGAAPAGTFTLVRRPPA